MLGMIALFKFKNDDGSINKLALAAVIISAVGMSLVMLLVFVEMLGGNKN